MAIQRKEILYFIADALNRTCSIDSDGNVVKDASPTPLPQHPSGWKDIQINFGTNQKYFSLNRSFTVPLKFVNDGAKILRYYQYGGRGYEEEFYVTILRWNRTNGIYELEYRGRIDFTTFQDEPEVGVTVNTIEGGVLYYLNSRENTQYEIACDATNPDAIKVAFDGIELFDKYNFSVIELEDAATLAGLVSYSTIPEVFFNNEGDSVGIAHGDQVAETFTDDTYYPDSVNYFFKNFNAETTVITFSKSVKFSIDLAPVGVFNILAVVLKSDGTITKTTLGTVATAGAVPYEIAIAGDVSVPTNASVFFVIEYVGSFIPFTHITFLESDFSIEFNSKNDPSSAYAIPPLPLLKTLVSLMSDGKYTADSALFATHKNIVASGGQAIRGLASAKLITSFADFFKSYNSIYNLGVKVVNNVLYVEPKGDLYKDDAEIFDLGEVSELKVNVAQEYIVNSVKTGFPVQDYQERNGRYEFNDTVEWKLPVTAVQKEYDLVSKYRGDGYGMEFIRGKLNNKDTTDDKGDNEVFLINIDNEGEILYVSADATKEEEDNISSGAIAFDAFTFFGGGENYFSGNAGKDTFTYINANPYSFRIDLSLYGLITGSGSVVFNVKLNGVVTYTATVPAIQHTFRISTNINQAFATSDVITVEAVVTSASVDITQAGLTFFSTTAVPTFSYTLKRGPYTVAGSTLQGVPTDTVFNIEEMTPKRQLLAHGNYLRGLMYQLPVDKITFQTADKNRGLYTDDGTVVIDEDADVQISELADPLFLPYILDFKTETPYTFAKIFAALARGYIKLTYKGYELYALPIGDMTAKSVTLEAQEWKLLAAPKTALLTLLKLSTDGLFITDYMQNTLFISDLNPVHFNKYDYQLHAKYHNKELYDDQFQSRNERFSTQPYYLQKFQTTDTISLQVVTAGLGQIEVHIFDAEANPVDVVVLDAIANPSVLLPYVLNQGDIPLTDYDEGKYLFVLFSSGVPLAISEWVEIAETMTKTYLFEYYNSFNKQNGYFNTWRPMFRVEGLFLPWQPESEQAEYEDEPGDLEMLHGIPNKRRRLIIGNGYGVPEWVVLKVNQILLLNRVNIEGQAYTRAQDSKFEGNDIIGYPMKFYSIDLKAAKNTVGLTISDSDVTPNNLVAYTLDAEAFGGVGTINVEIENN